MRQGGHDPRKVYAAYKAAFEHKGSPTVILARTIKGYGLGEAAKGRTSRTSRRSSTKTNCASSARASAFRSATSRSRRRLSIVPPEDSPEIQYLHARRKELGGYVPQRNVRSKPIVADHDALFREFHTGSEGREVSTTMAFVGMLRKMLRDPRNRKAGRSHRSRRSAHVRHGIAVPASRHLQQPRPALRAGRRPHAALLQGSEGRPDSRGRNHRSGLDGVVHRRGFRLCHARDQHDSLLYLLLDVRPAAHQRFDLGRGGYALPRIHAGRHGGAHNAGRRRLAASGRQQPRSRAADSQRCAPTIPRSLTKSRSSSRTASGACTRTAKAFSITSP